MPNFVLMPPERPSVTPGPPTPIRRSGLPLASTHNYCKPLISPATASSEPASERDGQRIGVRAQYALNSPIRTTDITRIRARTPHRRKGKIHRVTVISGPRPPAPGPALRPRRRYLASAHALRGAEGGISGGQDVKYSNVHGLLRTAGGVQHESTATCLDSGGLMRTS
jgi:hypothetical protein